LQADAGDFVVLELEEVELTAPVKYEAPATVGNIAHMSNSSDNTQLPHICGLINSTAMVRLLRASAHQTFRS
jgi:hypothetical protein